MLKIGRNTSFSFQLRVLTIFNAGFRITDLKAKKLRYIFYADLAFEDGKLKIGMK